jgi:hypothetical protein
MSGYAVETGFARSREAFAQIEGWLDGPEAAALDHAAVEEQLQARGREMLQLLFQDHLDARAAREQRLGQVTGPDGIVRRRAERGHSRPLTSVFGPVQVSRIAYRAPGARNAHPADEQLNLPAGKHSHGLSRLVAQAAAGGSLAAACAQVTARTGCTLGTRQCQQLARRAACDFADFYASRRPPPGAAPGNVLVLEVDAKGIAVRPGQQRPRSARAVAGPPRNKTAGCPAARSAPASGWPRPARSSTSPPSPAPPRPSWTPTPARRPPGPRASG